MTDLIDGLRQIGFTDSGSAMCHAHGGVACQLPNLTYEATPASTMVGASTVQFGGTFNDGRTVAMIDWTAPSEVKCNAEIYVFAAYPLREIPIDPEPQWLSEGKVLLRHYDLIKRSFR